MWSTRPLLLILVLAASVELSAAPASELPVNRVESAAEKRERVRDLVLEELAAGLVFRTPEMDQSQVVNLTYDAKSELSADLYYPPGSRYPALLSGAQRSDDVPAMEERSPVVLFPQGFQASVYSTSGVVTQKDIVSSVDLGALFASHGIVSIAYDAEHLDVDFRTLWQFLLENEESLGIDLARVGIYATSGNGRFASRVLGFPELTGRIRCGIFVHADVRPTILPEGDVSYYVIYSDDGSQFKTLSAAFIKRVESRNQRVIVVDDAPYKGYLFYVESDETREATESLAEFARESLVGER